MKKTVLLLIILSLVFSLFSCGDREYDEAEVRAAAETLIKSSEKLNEIFWGKGIEYVEDTNTSNGYYYEASYLALKEYGFFTLAELEELTRATFSEKFADTAMKTTTSSISDETGVQILARYYQKYSDVKMTKPECIMVYSKAIPLLKDTVVYDYSSITVTHSEKEKVFVNINCTVTASDGRVQEKTLEISLIEEEAGWRLASPTYASYDKDYYDKLKDKED